jgi:predicted DNA-binding protein (UPF0251 family)
MASNENDRIYRKAKRLIDSGKGWSEVGRKLGISRNVLQRIFAKRGEGKLGMKRGRKREWDLDEALRLKKEEKLSYAEISRRMDVDYNTLYMGLKRYDTI